MAEQIDVLKFLNDPELIKEINALMNHIILRPAPPAGSKYKRSPEDTFIKENNFTATYFIEQFKLTLEKKCTLNRSLRDCIQVYVSQAMYNLYLKTQQNKKENGNEEESRG